MLNIFNKTKYFINNRISKYYNYPIRYNCSQSNNFEPVYKLPFIKHVAILNRLKVYHMMGSVISIPSCTLLEYSNILQESAGLSALYTGIAGGILLSLPSIMLTNTIGFIYTNKDENKIKISYVDFWGRRKDRIISSDDWIPIFELPPKLLDKHYLTPKLYDGTKYLLFTKYGAVLDNEQYKRVLG